MEQQSPMFKSKGEQVLKEVSVRNMADHKKWAPKIWPECEYEDEVCHEASINEVLVVVNSIKADQAAGVDKVMSTMLHSASHGFLVKLTSMINGCLASGYVPSSLQSGKMMFINKKEPSLEVKNKRPLTVYSVLLSVFTKLLHKIMNAV